MQPMIERIARELASHQNQPQSWPCYVTRAQALLIAMREPTEHMRDGLPRDYRPGSHSAREIWNGLIDGALAEWRASQYSAARSALGGEVASSIGKQGGLCNAQIEVDDF